MGNKKIKCGHEQILFIVQICPENARENDELNDLSFLEAKFISSQTHELK